MGFTWGLRFYHLCKAEPDMRLTLVKPRTLTSVKTGADFLVFLMVLARYRIQEEHSSFWNAPTNSGGIIRVEKGTSDYTVKLCTPPPSVFTSEGGEGVWGKWNLDSWLASPFKFSLFVPRGYRVQKTLIIDTSYNCTFPWLGIFTGH
jgi:hypothetical protein